MTLGIVLGCIAVYVWVGWHFVAPAWVKSQMDESVQRWPTLAKDPAELRRWRKEAAALAWGPALVWPFWFAGRVLTRRLVKRSGLTDYEVQRRIAELERDLDIR